MTIERFQTRYRLPDFHPMDKDHAYTALWHYPFNFIDIDRDTTYREKQLNLRYDNLYELRKPQKCYSEQVIKHILSPMFARKPGPTLAPIEYKIRNNLVRKSEPFIHTLKPYAYLPEKIDTYLEVKLEYYNSVYLDRKERKHLSPQFVGHLVREYGYELQ
jgi:hypothetical protein